MLEAESGVSLAAMGYCCSLFQVVGGEERKVASGLTKSQIEEDEICGSATRISRMTTQ